MKKCPKCGHVRQPGELAPDYECPACGVVYAKFDDPDEGIPEAWRVRHKPERQRPARRREVASRSADFTGFSKRQLYGLVGTALMAIGVFMPLMTGPFGMNVNYFANGKGDGWFILGLAACSIALIIARRFSLLWVTGGLSFGLIGFTFFQFQSRISEVQSTMNKDLQGNPFRGLADAAMSSVQMQWGWLVLLIGAALILLCAWMNEEPR